MKAALVVWVIAAGLSFVVQVHEARLAFQDLRRVSGETGQRALARRVVARANVRSIAVRLLTTLTFLILGAEILMPPLGLQLGLPVLTVVVLGTATAILQAAWSILDQRDRATLIRYYRRKIGGPDENGKTEAVPRLTVAEGSAARD